jgi:hypothetical protein
MKILTTMEIAKMPAEFSNAEKLDAGVLSFTAYSLPLQVGF